jgi:hypothetical protein
MPKGNTISKKQVIAPAITAALVLMMSPAMLSTPAAFAVEPTSTTRDGGLHFVGDPDLQRDDGTLTATGEVAGAGTRATATLEATASATLGCVNRGGNEPSGLQEVDTTTSGSETFNTRSGRGSFEVTTDEVTASDFDFSCPSRNMREVVVGDITFTDITLTITSQTGTITATFPDQ